MFLGFFQKLMNQKTSVRVKIETESDDLLTGVHNDYTMYLTEDGSFLVVYLSLEKSFYLKFFCKDFRKLF